MKKLAMVIGLASLAGTIVPPALFMMNKMPHTTMQQVMLVSAVAWFVTAPVWMKAE
ncbi:MAG: hypothetical protein ACO3NZ_08085 [Pirellulales bacterium]|jgi:hypothetical protein